MGVIETVYYVVSDIHGFFSETESALDGAGYFDERLPHKLIVCGDFFDRGKEAVKMQDFLCELMRKDEAILVRGNHEDLALDLLDTFSEERDVYAVPRHHFSNGTFDTFMQLADMTLPEVMLYPDKLIKRVEKSPFFKLIIPNSVDYFETKNYVFVHGWIPFVQRPFEKAYFEADWRSATPSMWRDARWINGMQAYFTGATLPDKTVVCGHFHSSYGHSRADGTPEFGEGADFSPFAADGIIAVDACTAYSKRVNVLRLDDDEL